MGEPATPDEHVGEVMLPAELRLARDLVNATTPGNWKPCGEDERGCYVKTAPGDGQMFSICAVYSFDRREADAAFIAASHQLVPQLLDEVDRLSAALRHVTRERDEALATAADFKSQQTAAVATLSTTLVDLLPTAAERQAIAEWQPRTYMGEPHQLVTIQRYLARLVAVKDCISKDTRDG